MKMLALAGAFICLAPIGVAYASDTTTYSYDAAGRLISSTIQGGPNNGTTSNITLDPAGNRTNYGVTTSGGCQLSVTDGQGTDEFTIYISVQAASACSGPVTLAYTMQGNAQVQVGSGTVTLAQGATSQNLAIYPVSGSIPSGDSRTLYVNFTVQAGSASLTDAQSQVTIWSSL